MKGDFSKDSFDPKKQFRRVLMQQGRVLLDSDFNEQVSILLDYMQTLAEDLIGPHGGPEGPEVRCGFEVIPTEGANNFQIGAGNYYINGMLCRNRTKLLYTAQPGLKLEELRDDRRYLVYLEAWERHVTAAEDESLREEALGGADTTTRSQVAWRVRTLDHSQVERDEKERGLIGFLEDILKDIFDPEKPDHTPDEAYRLLEKRRTVRQEERAKLSVPLPNAGYRGSENQLFRVEIHDGGTTEGNTPTCKWARDNASVVFPIVSLEGATARVEHLGEDSDSPLRRDDWVEIVDRKTAYQKAAYRDKRVPLLQVRSIDRVDSSVTLAVPDGVELPVYGEYSDERPLLRRWDSPGAVEINRPPEDDEQHTEIRLTEEGIRVRFETGRFKSGDYWLIPVRAGASDNVMRDGEQEAWSKWMPPHGVSRYYAPLAVLSFRSEDCGKGSEDRYKVQDCRRVFKPLAMFRSATSEDGDEHYRPQTLLGLWFHGAFHALDDLLTIGRNEESSVTVPLDTVSWDHAQIERSGEEAVLTVYEGVSNDIVRVNGQHIRKGQTARLGVDDVVQIGTEIIKVVEKEANE